MNARSAFVVASLALLFGLCPAVAAQMSTGIVTMTTTSDASSITLNITIADPGTVTGCTYFIITRDGTVVGIFQRQLGVQNVLTYTDTNVVPDRFYFYELVSNSIPAPFPFPPCDEYQFRTSFGSSWGAPINIPGHLGTNPVPVAHGKLVTDQSGFLAYIEDCNGAGPGGIFDLPPGNEQYIGKEVVLYGDYTGWGQQNGWDFRVASFALVPCAPIPTRSATWGYVKTLYR